MVDLFSLREAEIFKTLQELRKCDLVIIGGYAVNAYALPRFSVDCDVVIKDDHELKIIEKVLLNLDYQKQSTPKNSSYRGSFYRYEKILGNNFTVSMDVLSEAVSDRMTGVIFPADWIFQNSQIRILRGKTISEQLNVRIITIDALLVMKIISCRATDIRDVFMMLPNAGNKSWVKSEVAERYDFKNRIDMIFQKVNSKQFYDGLRGVYGYFDPKVFEKHRKELKEFEVH